MQTSDTQNYSEAPEEIVRRIRGGEISLREPFILSNLKTTISTVSAITGRVADNKSEELKIAIKAFNEAIDLFNLEKGEGFLLFSEALVQKRVTEYIEAQKAVNNEAQPNPAPVNQQPQTPVFTEYQKPDKKNDTAKNTSYLNEDRDSTSDSAIKIEKQEEIMNFAMTLQTYGIKMTEIGKYAPDDSATKIMCIEIVEMLMLSPQLTEYIQKNKKIPIKHIIAQLGADRKVVAKNSKYILILYIIRSSNMQVLKGYLENFRKGGK